MKNILYVVAVLLILIWAIGSFVYSVASTFFHLLLVFAVIAILVNMFKRKSM